MDKHLENDMRKINARRDSQLPDVLALPAARSDALRMLVSKPRTASPGGRFQFTCASRFMARFPAPWIALRSALASVVLCTVFYSAREWLGDTLPKHARLERVSPAAATWNGNEAVDAKEFQRRLASISMHSAAINRSTGLLHFGVSVDIGLLNVAVEYTP